MQKSKSVTRQKQSTTATHPSPARASIPVRKSSCSGSAMMSNGQCSGLASPALLELLDILRSVEGLFVGRTNALEDTHPKTHLRIAKSDSVALVSLTEFAALRRFWLTCARSLSLVRSILLDALRELSPKLKRGASRSSNCPRPFPLGRNQRATAGIESVREIWLPQAAIRLLLVSLG